MGGMLIGLSTDREGSIFRPHNAATGYENINKSVRMKPQLGRKTRLTSLYGVAAN